MALDLLGIKNSGPVPLPRQRRMFAFLKSPFKYKKFQELWEIRVISRVLTFETDVLTTRRILPYIYKAKYDGVGLRVKRLSFEPLEKYYKDPYLHTGDVDRLIRLEALRASASNKRGWPTQAKDNKTASFITIQDGAVTSRPLSPPLSAALTAGVLDEDFVYDDADYQFKLTKNALGVEDEITREVDTILSSLRTSEL